MAVGACLSSGAADGGSRVEDVVFNFSSAADDGGGAAAPTAASAVVSPLALAGGSAPGAAGLRDAFWSVASRCDCPSPLADE